MVAGISNNPDALPQLIGEFRPVDEWQAHINEIFYGLRGGRLREFYQTFAAADYRLAHALAADYYERVIKRERERATGKGQAARGESKINLVSRLSPLTPLTHQPQAAIAPVHPESAKTDSVPMDAPLPEASRLLIHEWGCGNGNLAACFLTHLKRLDKEGSVYPRARYVLVDAHEATLQAALAHPDLAEHRHLVEARCSRAEDLKEVKDGTVDRILCNELWNDLPTKLMLRKAGEIEEEFLRPNLTETKQAEISDWSAFMQTFDQKDISRLSEFPAFLEDIIWEREYRKADWKEVPYRKTITEFLKKIDDEVLVPVNLGACATVKEAKRLLAPDAVGFSSFDAGTADLKILNDPEKPCYGQFGGQYSFMVNFALIESVARHHGVAKADIETQREFVGRSLNTNVLSLMDLLATHPTSASLKPWQQDRLLLRTVRALNETYESPYHRKIDFSLSKETPPDERESLQHLLSLKENGVPDTIAYLTEEELFTAIRDLEALEYDREVIQAALMAPPQGVDYYHHFFRP